MSLRTPAEPTFEDIRKAADRLRGKSVQTPLLHVPELDALVGARVFLKAETLQRTGSFKFRGAYNALASIEPQERARGVVACSSGNHAQGVAAAAAMFAVPATIVMPADAPRTKRERTRALGATIVSYDRAHGDRELLAAEIVARTGAHFIAPYDNAQVICGQGTTGLELVEQAAALGAKPDLVLVPCSGGGLTAGIALALARLAPSAAVWTVEPDGFDDHARSFVTGQRERNSQASGSICDALLASQPGELTFAVNRKHVAGGVSVSDADVMAAMAFASQTLKLVVEPGGAVALAALLSGTLACRDKTVVVILSGGNCDPGTLVDALERSPAAGRSGNA